MRKLTLDLEGGGSADSPPAIFEVGMMSTGVARIALRVPDDHSDLFGRLANLFPPPFYVLYVLHTPRGEGEAGRYQSRELSKSELNDLLNRYASFFASDGRHDLWVHSPRSGHTLIWDRHNFLFVEGEPLDSVRRVLVDLGFHEGRIEPLGVHVHQYRAEFDDDAASLLSEFDWRRTPLRPEDEQ
ncbi:hypothetical protein [Zavarzinia sp.]|uniref:hypothetical protein n=1 Tax=Zavarzinia sp. TaxID=2027920 RepID=UPI0035682373